MKNPAAPPEIEITPAMIEAGVNAAMTPRKPIAGQENQRFLVEGWGTLDRLVSAIYTAMLKARG